MEVKEAIKQLSSVCTELHEAGTINDEQYRRYIAMWLEVEGLSEVVDGKNEDT
jgi:hypothetical protein